MIDGGRPFFRLFFLETALFRFRRRRTAASDDDGRVGDNGDWGGLGGFLLLLPSPPEERGRRNRRHRGFEKKTFFFVRQSTRKKERLRRLVEQCLLNKFFVRGIPIDSFLPLSSPSLPNAFDCLARAPARSARLQDRYISARGSRGAFPARSGEALVVVVASDLFLSVDVVLDPTFLSSFPLSSELSFPPASPDRALLPG